MQNPTIHLSQLKARAMPFTLIPSEKKLCRPLAIFHGVLIAPPQKKSKYRSWYLTPCCGLEVQDPTQALKSVKGPGNTFDLNPKWERTLPSFGNFLWDTYSPPPKKQSKYQSWYLTPCCVLEVQNPTQALNSVKDPGNIFDLSLKWERTLPSFVWQFFMGHL